MIFLAQSDTTVGFLSQSAKEINHIKHRKASQKVLSTVASLQDIPTRVPKKFRAMVRRMTKTSVVLPNTQAYRVVPKTSKHHTFLQGYGILFSSSANQAGERFDAKKAFKQADIIVADDRGFYEATASQILKIGKTTLKRVRS